MQWRIKIIRWGIISVLLIILAILYKVYNPYESTLFPKCPFRQLTSLKCPGCGSQRGIHYLLNFDIQNAFKENMLLVLSIPYILVGFVFDIIKKPNKSLIKWRKRLFGQTAIFIILIIVIGFWILRNTVFFDYI